MVAVQSIVTATCPVPTPGRGRSTEDPVTPTLRQLAQRAAQAGPQEAAAATPDTGAAEGGPSADAVAAGLGAAAGLAGGPPPRPEAYGPQAAALRRAALHGTPLQEICS